MSALSFEKFIQNELQVDQFLQDVTGHLLSKNGQGLGRAVVFAKEPGIFSGNAILESFKHLFSGSISFKWEIQEGDSLLPNKPFLYLEGPKNLLLSVERTLLNFLGLACGVASHTRRFVDAVKPHPVSILATRKTLPGLRALQLNSVVAGGGKIHRRSLSDGILIKENHCALEDALILLERAHSLRSPLHGIEIEVQNFEMLNRVLAALHPPEVIMLDNFSVEATKRAVLLIREKLPTCRIEASGGMTLESVKFFAETGVDFISVGALTHSAPNLNLSLDFTA